MALCTCRRPIGRTGTTQCGWCVYSRRLQIRVGATTGEIQSAARGLRRKYHPDANIGVSERERARLEDLCKEIGEAEDWLRDPVHYPAPAPEPLPAAPPPTSEWEKAAGEEVPPSWAHDEPIEEEPPPRWTHEEPKTSGGWRVTDDGRLVEDDIPQWTPPPMGRDFQQRNRRLPGWVVWIGLICVLPVCLLLIALLVTGVVSGELKMPTYGKKQYSFNPNPSANPMDIALVRELLGPSMDWLNADQKKKGQPELDGFEDALAMHYGSDDKATLSLKPRIGTQYLPKTTCYLHKTEKSWITGESWTVDRCGAAPIEADAATPPEVSLRINTAIHKWLKEKAPPGSDASIKDSETKIWFDLYGRWNAVVILHQKAGNRVVHFMFAPGEDASKPEPWKPMRIFSPF